MFLENCLQHAMATHAPHMTYDRYATLQTEGRNSMNFVILEGVGDASLFDSRSASLRQ